MTVTYRTGGSGVDAAETASLSYSGTFTIPIGVVAGDQMYLALMIVCAGTTSGAINTPTGWTAVGTLQAYEPFGAGTIPAQLVQLFTRTAAGGDAGSTPAWSGTGGGSFAHTRGSYAIVAYSSAASGAFNLAWNTANSGTSGTAPSVAAPLANSLVVEIATATGGTAGTWTGGSLPATNRVSAASAATANYGSQYMAVSDVAAPTQGTSYGGGVFTVGGAATADFVVASFAIEGAIAPNAPTLASPGGGAFLDVSGGVTFQSIYNSTDTANENAYALRQKVSGAGSYNYWTGTAWQSTIIWPAVSVAPAGTTSVGPISTGLADGNVYNWSMASQEAFASIQGPFASDFAFSAQAAPILVVNGPTGTVVNTNMPSVAWTTTPAASASQTAYRIVVEHGAYGSVPGSGTQDWDSGTITSSAQSANVGVALSNGTTYRAFVMVTETGGITSSWQFVTFTVSLDLPQTPTIAAVVGTDPSTGCPRIALTVQGRDNALTATQASFEDGTTTGWAAGASTVIANTTAQADDGTHSMSLTRQTTTGAASATTPTGASGIPVTPSQPWQALANFRTAVTGRTCTVQVLWYKASGAASSVRVSDTSAGVTDTTSGWTQAALAVTSPSDAAFAALVVSVAGAVANEVHYVDNIDLGPGSSAVWTRGGLVGSSTVAILRSDGLYVRLASIATPTTIPSPSQTVTVYDYEAVPGVAYTYTAVVSAVIGGSTISSAASAATGSVTVALATYGWWWLDPTNPSTAVTAQPVQWQPAQVEQSSAHPVLQQVTANIVAAAMMNPGFAGQIEVFDNTTYTNFVALITSQTTLFISSPWGSADSGYFRVGPSPDGMSSGMGLKVKAAQLLPSAGTAGHRTVDVSAAPQPRPTV